MSRVRLALFVILAGMLAVMVYTPTQPAQAQARGAAIRAVNASPDAVVSFFFINEKREETQVARDLRSGGSYDYFKVPAGSYELSFRRGKEVVNDNSVVKVDLQDGDYVTLAAVNTLKNLQAVALKDNTSAVARGSVRVRVINAVVGGPSLDVTAGEDKLFTGVDFAKASDYATLQSGKVSFSMLEAGAAADKKAVATLRDQDLPREKNYDLFVVGETGGRVRVVLIQSDTQLAKGTNQIRFGHFVQGAGLVDVSLNGEPAFRNVKFGDVTFAFVVAPGDYNVQVYPAGKKDKPILEKKITVAENKAVLAAAVNPAEKADLSSFEDDASQLRVGKARVNFFHAAAGGPDVSLQILNGPTLVQAVPFGKGGSAEVGGGVYVVRVVAADGKVLAERGNVKFNPGTGNTVVYYDDDPTKGAGNASVYSYELPTVVPVRLVHASAKAKAVDVYIDGEKALPNWGFGSKTDYMDLKPGSHNIKVFTAGADPTKDKPAIDKKVDLAGFAITAIAYDASSGPTLALLPDNLQSPGGNRGRFAVFNMSADLGAVRWINAAGNNTIGSPIPLGGASDAVNFDAGSYTFEIRSTSNAKLTFRLNSIKLDAGAYIVFVLTGPTVDDVVTLEYVIAPAK